MVDGSLLLIWYASLAVSLIAVGMLALLVLVRMASAIGSTRRGLAKKNLSRLLIEISAGREIDESVIRRLTRDRRLAAQALVEFSTLVRGDELQDALDQLKAAGLGRRLQPLLAHQSSEVRVLAIEAIGLLMDDRNEKFLQWVIRRNRSLRNVVAAARALQNSGRKLELDAFLADLRMHRASAPAELNAVLADIAREDPERLSAVLKDHMTDVSVKVQIISALGASGHYTLVETLIAILDSGEQQERVAAAAALGVLGHPAARAALKRALKDQDPDVRAEAAEAVGQIMLEALQADLAALVSDETWSVRFQAARALLQFGDSGRQALADIIETPSDARAVRTAELVLAEGRAT